MIEALGALGVEASAEFDPGFYTGRPWVAEGAGPNQNQGGIEAAMKRYPKGKQLRKLAATLARLDRILAGSVPEVARDHVQAARNATAQALKEWGRGGRL